MIVDADERVSEQLRLSIQKALEAPDEYDGFFVKRESFFLDRLIKHGGWHKEYILRLFNRKRGRYQDRHVHACVEVAGKTEFLDGPLYHHTYKDLDDYFEKFVRYTKWAAEDLKDEGRRSSFINLALRPWARFLKMYVLRRGFLDGKHGLVLSYLAAFSVFTKYARLWQADTQKEIDRAAAPSSSLRSTGEGAPPHTVRGKS
jgi:hypothetical protein